MLYSYAVQEAFYVDVRNYSLVVGKLNGVDGVVF